MESKIKFNFNWVLINELAIGNLPSSKEDIKLLKNKKIKSVLTLCSKDESIGLKNLNKLFIHKNFFLPDHKYDQLISINDISNTMEILADLLDLGPVFVHCVAAMERSPLISMAWLIKSKKLNPDQALDYLMQVNPGTNPLPEQIKVLQEFYMTLKINAEG